MTPPAPPPPGPASPEPSPSTSPRPDPSPPTSAVPDPLLPDLSLLSDDALAKEVTVWAARVAAGEARLVALIGELDARGAWAGVGVLSCAHWLSYQCRMGLKAAYERVRVARALRELPLVARAFAAGALSWTQVRAITRVATAADEQTWVEVASSCSGAQIEKLTAAVHREQLRDPEAQDPEAAAERLRPRLHQRPDGRVALTFIVEQDEATVVLAAFERVLDQFRTELDALPLTTPDEGAAEGDTPDQPLPALQTEPPMPSCPAGMFGTAQDRATWDAWTTECHRVAAHNRQVERLKEQRAFARAQAAAAAGLPAKPTWTDALLRLAAHALDAPGQLPLAAKERLRVCIDPLSGWARLRDGQLLAPGRVPIPPGPFVPADLTCFDKGRTSREVPLPLRRLLGQVDGERCRMPGCTRHTGLHAHHVRYWSHGGPTDLANLILVCNRHHTLIHTDGYQLTLHPDRQLTVRTADGTLLPHHPTPVTATPDELLDHLPHDPHPQQPAGDHLDLDHATWVLLQHAA